VSSKRRASQDTTPLMPMTPLIDIIRLLCKESISLRSMKESNEGNGFWECNACTLLNAMSLKVCSVCNTKREPQSQKPPLVTHPRLLSHEAVSVKKRKRTDEGTKVGNFEQDGSIVIIDEETDPDVSYEYR